jgi:hypothetical protein
MVSFARSAARRILPYSVRKALYPIFFGTGTPTPTPAVADDHIVALLVTFDRRISNLEAALAAQKSEAATIDTAQPGSRV